MSGSSASASARRITSARINDKTTCQDGQEHSQQRLRCTFARYPASILLVVPKVHLTPGLQVPSIQKKQWLSTELEDAQCCGTFWFKIRKRRYALNSLLRELYTNLHSGTRNGAFVEGAAPLSASILLRASVILRFQVRKHQAYVYAPNHHHNS